MQPIVYGLEVDYAGQIAVDALNARDDAVGEAAFTALRLPGHPSIVIFDAAGNETFRQFGIIPEETLIVAIEDVLAPSP